MDIDRQVAVAVWAFLYRKSFYINRWLFFPGHGDRLRRGNTKYPVSKKHQMQADPVYFNIA